MYLSKRNVSWSCQESKPNISAGQPVSYPPQILSCHASNGDGAFESYTKRGGGDMGVERDLIFTDEKLLDMKSLK
jgi:hypothetical protein